MVDTGNPPAEHHDRVSIYQWGVGVFTTFSFMTEGHIADVRIEDMRFGIAIPVCFISFD